MYYLLVIIMLRQLNFFFMQCTLDKMLRILRGHFQALDISFMRFILYLIMQSISQKNNNLTAYQDKAKLLFLEQQIYFLQKFKQDVLNLQALAKPRSNPHEQIKAILKKLTTKSYQIQQDVVFIRRDISMIQANNLDKFQQQVAKNYIINSQQTDLKLQKVQSRVQIAQEKSKSQIFQKQAKLLNVKPQRQQIINKYLKYKQNITKSLRKRLILAGEILQRKKKCKQILETQKFIKNSSFFLYNFQIKHQKYYRNKSMDRLNCKIQNKELIKAKKSQKNIIDSVTKLQKRTLQVYQGQIIINQLNNIKLINQKLQMINQSLKKSIQIQDDNKLLDALNKNKHLDYQKSIVREVLAYRMMQARFNEKLCKYSYKWSYQDKIQKKNYGSSQWIESPQNIQFKHLKWEIKRKVNSLQKNKEPIIQFIGGYPNNSTSTTNRQFVEKKLS